MPVEKQESRFVGLAMTRETAVPRVLPANPVWETREPNEFGDFGAEYTMLARRPYSTTRSRKKGSVVDRDDRFGFNEDVTQNNMQRRIEEFCFAAIRSTPFAFATAAVSASSQYTVAGGLPFVAGSLILASGFANAANNGLKVVTASAAASVTIASVLVQEVAAPAGAKIKNVGFAFAAGDISLARVGARVVMTTKVVDFRTLPLIPGQWVFVGGDSVGDQLNGVAPGYARIALDGVAQRTLTFDKTTFAVAAGFATDGAGKTIRMFFGDTVKNETDPDLIVRYTVQAERFLGRDDDGRQSQFLEGGTANELTWNSPLADKVTVDLAYIAMYYGKRPGTLGPKSAAAGATLTKALGEDAINTTSNVYRLRASIIDPLTLNPTPLFARVTEWSATLANNTTANKSQGTLGAFDTTSGMFDVDAEFTAYFSTLAAIQAIEDDADVTFDAIYSKKNAAIIIDLPLVGVGGGELDISMDEAIMLPITTAAAESPFGHTILFGWLPYVPSVGNASG